MKSIQVDGIRVQSADYLPTTVRAEDGREYHVLGVVVQTMGVAIPVVPEPAEGVLGRRLCLLLGERVMDAAPPNKIAGVPLEIRGTGH